MLTVLLCLLVDKRTPLPSLQSRNTLSLLLFYFLHEDKSVNTNTVSVQYRGCAWLILKLCSIFAIAFHGQRHCASQTISKLLASPRPDSIIMDCCTLNGALCFLSMPYAHSTFRLRSDHFETCSQSFTTSASAQHRFCIIAESQPAAAAINGNRNFVTLKQSDSDGNDRFIRHSKNLLERHSEVPSINVGRTKCIYVRGTKRVNIGWTKRIFCANKSRSG